MPRLRSAAAARVRVALAVACAAGLSATCERVTGTNPAAPVDRILAPLTSSDAVVLPGSRHPRARPAWDLGPVDDDQVLDNLALRFRPAPAQQEALRHLLDDQQNPGSPQYHQWIDRAELGARFGVTDHDLDAAADWLRSEGLTIQRRTHDHLSLYFSGTAAQVERVFRTQLHDYRVGDETFYANATDVSVPRPLGDMLYLVGGLDNVRPRPQGLLQRRERPVKGSGKYTLNGDDDQLVPRDLATIYGFSALWDGGVGSPGPALDGTGMTIAVIGQTSYTPADIDNFRSLSALPPAAITDYPLPGGSASDMGSSGDVEEATIDLEWSGAAAYNAAISYVFAGSSTQTAFNALEYTLENPELVGSPQVVTISYVACEPETPGSYALFLESEVMSANAGGVTVLAGSGDSGAAGCDPHNDEGQGWSTYGLAVELPASIPEVTAVGGTEFNEGTGTYWAPTNGVGGESALSYIPEVAWNETANGLSASGGGASVVFPRPAWQAGTGMDDGGYRAVPDVAMPTALYHDGYLACLTDARTGPPSCAFRAGWATNAGGPTPDDGTRLTIVGGTSVASPVFASMVTLLAQAWGQSAGDGGTITGLGNINPRLYAMAADPRAAVFHDITQGSNIVPCEAGLPGCTNGSFGFEAVVGYDEVTGLGSVDAWNLWSSYPSRSDLGTLGAPGLDAGPTACPDAGVAGPDAYALAPGVGGAAAPPDPRTSSDHPSGRSACDAGGSAELCGLLGVLPLVLRRRRRPR